MNAGKMLRIILCALLCPLAAYSQSYSVDGRVVDAQSNDPLVGTNVLLLRLSDSTHTGAGTDSLGRFLLSPLNPGDYSLSITHVGYAAKSLKVTVVNNDINIGIIMLEQTAIPLGSVVVSGEETFEITSRIGSKRIERIDGGHLGSLGRVIPSVKTQTNSRGETHFQFRGAGERQVTILLDGIPLNIPWDNRSDLSMISNEIIGQIELIKGSSSTLYGPNTIGGVIKLSSVDMSKRSGFRGRLVLADDHQENYLLNYAMGTEGFSSGVSVSWKSVGNYRLPRGGRRINSHRRSGNLFAKLQYAPNNELRIGLITHYTDASKGVPPELHIGSPRYWNYPFLRNIMVGVQGEYTFAPQQKIDFSLSLVNQKTRIEQFADASFSTFSDIEDGDDLTIYGAVKYQVVRGKHSLLRFSTNVQSSKHFERILSDGNVERLYSQNIISLGGEYEYFGGGLTIVAGLGYDHSATPHTGDKPSTGQVADISFSSNAKYALDDNLTLKFSFGRKTRFPSLREAFSGALGKFIPNPQLKPEVGASGMVGLFADLGIGKIDVDVFGYYITDGISRVTFSGGKFQRVNKDVIRIVGVESEMVFDLAKDLSASWNMTLMNSAGRNSDGAFKDTLEYRPQLNSSFGLTYEQDGITITCEMTYVGGEYGLHGEKGHFDELPHYFLMNVRVSYTGTFSILGSLFTLKPFFRVNNIFDRAHYSQLGLPEAGRQVFFGFDILD